MNAYITCACTVHTCTHLCQHNGRKTATYGSYFKRKCWRAAEAAGVVSGKVKVRKYEFPISVHVKYTSVKLAPSTVTKYTGLHLHGTPDLSLISISQTLHNYTSILPRHLKGLVLLVQCKLQCQPYTRAYHPLPTQNQMSTTCCANGVKSLRKFHHKYSIQNVLWVECYKNL